MSSTGLARRRVLVGTIAAGLTLGTLTTAQAEPAPREIITVPQANPRLEWHVSTEFDRHFTTRTLSGNVTTDSRDGRRPLRFHGGRTNFSTTTGVTTVAYTGTVRSRARWGESTDHELTLANPTLEVAADGSGRLTADVSSAVLSSEQDTPPSTTGPTRVTVTTISADRAILSRHDGIARLVGTPDWAGVLPAASEAAADLGLIDGQPIDGKSFAPQFLAALTPRMRTHFLEDGWGVFDKTPGQVDSLIGSHVLPVQLSTTVPYASGRSISFRLPVPGRVEIEHLGSRSTPNPGGIVSFPVPRRFAGGAATPRLRFDPAAPHVSASSSTARITITRVAAPKVRFVLTKKQGRRGTADGLVRATGVAGGEAPSGAVRLKFSRGKKVRHGDAYMYQGHGYAIIPRLPRGRWTVRAAYRGDQSYLKRGWVKAGSFKVTR